MSLISVINVFLHKERVFSVHHIIQVEISSNFFSHHNHTFCSDFKIFYAFFSASTHKCKSVTWILDMNQLNELDEMFSLILDMISYYVWEQNTQKRTGFNFALRVNR